MTFDEWAMKKLTENGMFDLQAKAVVAQYLEGVGEPMANRWADQIDGYPDVLLAGVWLGLESTALDWIDENVPKAWFRPMFAE